MTKMTPYDVILDALHEVDYTWDANGRNEVIRKEQATAAVRDLVWEYQTVTLNGQRFLLVPLEPLITIKNPLPGVDDGIPVEIAAAA